MTKKEKAFIQARIVQYRKWAAEEREAEKRATDKETKDDKWIQYRLNESAADTLDLLLQELEEI